jgi:hypothetical protein
MAAPTRHSPSLGLSSTPSPKREAEHVVRFQLVIDCADPDRLARFWAAALHYELEPVPDGL